MRSGIILWNGFSTIGKQTCNQLKNLVQSFHIYILKPQSFLNHSILFSTEFSKCNPFIGIKFVALFFELKSSLFFSRNENLIIWKLFWKSLLTVFSVWEPIFGKSPSFGSCNDSDPFSYLLHFNNSMKWIKGWTLCFFHHFNNPFITIPPQNWYIPVSKGN